MVCREHCSSSQYSDLKKQAIPICSIPCTDKFDCTVCDAARATSAAPTFFPVMKIGDKFYVDGGLEHNNPSFAIHYHYMGVERKKSTRPLGSSSSSAPQYSAHDPLDCSRVRFTNIGTGANQDEVEPGKRDRLAGLVPSAIRKGIFLKKTLTEIAVNSARTVETMAMFQYLNPDVIMYERFDANHGVSNIKLDDHRSLGDIKIKTNLYLEEQETKDMLEEVGKAIAIDYFTAQSIQAHRTPIVPAADKSRQPLSVPTLRQASSSLSTCPSSNRSDDPESESSVLFPNHDSPPQGGPAKRAKKPSKALPPPDGQGHSIHLNQEDSGVDTAEPEILRTAVTKKSMETSTAPGEHHKGNLPVH